MFKQESEAITDMNNATCQMLRMIDFAVSKGLIEAEDRKYTLNLLLDIMKMDAPEEAQPCAEPLPATLTPMLTALCDIAVEKGLIADSQGARELFATRLCGAITPSPKEIRDTFNALRAEKGPEAATEWFYELCRANDYIRVDHIAKNVRFFSDSPCGELEITINLSKPEKDPKDIAAQRNAPQVGYPTCMLCGENPGYAGRIGFPARQNHRMVPIQLDGEKWHVQYSPYLYYPEHCIVLNDEHRPMKISDKTFDRLFDFVTLFPHYMLGSNADLPIVGGSILSHDHFQGGHYTFPMDKAPDLIAFKTPDEKVSAALIDWPMTCIRLRGKDREAIKAQAVAILNAWRAYSDEENDIFAETDAPHNTVTPVLHRDGDLWRLDLVLRNNRVSDEHPLGIFHPHAHLHHIKKENIGLIEVMGLFILPGRLLTELAALHPYLKGEKPLTDVPAEDSPIYKHWSWMLKIAEANGTNLTEDEAEAAIRRALAVTCSEVLADAGVYKQTEKGRAGVVKFMKTLGYEA